MSNKNRVPVTSLLIIIAIMLTYSGWQYYSRFQTKTEPELPTTGLSRNETHGKVPGDPRNGEELLARLYSYYLVYKERHGAYPKGTNAVVNDLRSNPVAYGLSKDLNMKGIVRLLKNPDSRYADSAMERKENVIVFNSPQQRPDGTPIFAAKRPGEKDILLYTETYIHENIKDFPNQRNSMNPVGFYQVLWEDGKVENVPYDKIVYVPNKSAKRGAVHTPAFRGQAGVMRDAIDYDTYWTRVAKWDKAPHGEENGSGIFPEGITKNR